MATILMMAEQVDWFNANGGLDWCAARTAESSSVIYDWADASTLATPFVANPAERSKVVATIDIDDAVDALEPMLADPRRGVPEAILEAFGKIATDRAVDVLVGGPAGVAVHLEALDLGEFELRIKELFAQLFLKDREILRGHDMRQTAGVEHAKVPLSFLRSMPEAARRPKPRRRSSIA